MVGGKNKKIALLLFSLTITVVLPGSVIAQSKMMADVNESCGYEVFTDCAGCHYDPEPSYQMTTYLTEGACGLCTEITSCNAEPPTEDDLLVDAQTVTNKYFKKLFGSFIKAMKEAGATLPGGMTDPNIFSAVFPACPDMAPILASEFSRDTGYLVRRVTTKTRNSRNIPDDRELEQLKNFEKMAAGGDPRTQFDITKPDGVILPTKEFEAFDVVKEGIGNNSELYFRYMRSITMPGMPNEPPFLPCLKCHGTIDQLGDGVAEAVAAEYPHDMSMGYKKGDIRGAWTIKIPLAAKP